MTSMILHETNVTIVGTIIAILTTILLTIVVIVSITRIITTVVAVVEVAEIATAVQVIAGIVVERIRIKNEKRAIAMIMMITRTTIGLEIEKRSRKSRNQNGRINI